MLNYMEALRSAKQVQQQLHRSSTTSAVEEQEIKSNSTWAEISKQPRERQDNVCKHKALARPRAQRRSQAESFLGVTSPRIPRPGSGAWARRAHPGPPGATPSQSGAANPRPLPPAALGSPRQPGTEASSGIPVFSGPSRPRFPALCRPPHRCSPAARAGTATPGQGRSLSNGAPAAGGLRPPSCWEGPKRGAGRRKEPAPYPAALTRGSRGSAVHLAVAATRHPPLPRGRAQWLLRGGDHFSGHRARARRGGGPGAAVQGRRADQGAQGRGLLAQPPPMFVIVVSRFRRECMPGEGGPEKESRGGSGGNACVRGRRKSRLRAHPGRRRGQLKRGVGGGRERRPLTALRDARSEVAPTRGRRLTRLHPHTDNGAGSSAPPRLTNLKFIPSLSGEGGAECTHHPDRAPLVPSLCVEGRVL
ncbi:uncharacterized protein [Patagioenas fasciata]|uniref:uncharacterized protein n=1 Tax=Patagioenas fasciata TaxID=372321 RepID=UPI003A9A1158